MKPFSIIRDWGTDHKMGTLDTTLPTHLAARTQFSRRKSIETIFSQNFQLLK